MFTGIIEEVGKIEMIRPVAGGRSLMISCRKALEGIKTGDSVSVNGICLTVTKFTANHFYADAVGETINKTTVKTFRIGEAVNIERALLPSQRIGGHFVQGHINGTGIISEIKKMGENYSLSVTVPDDLERYMIIEGSVALDGISLTVASLFKNKVTISVIPHTYKTTNLSRRRTGDSVNIEADFMAKYMEKLMTGNTERKTSLSEETLNKLGY
jgi:riboflavin synthase